MASEIMARSSTVQQLPRAHKKRKRSSSLGTTSASKLQKTGDTPDDHPAFLSHTDANKILDILELSDTQGLLDRVFPSNHAPDTLLSLRTLLERPAEHPLTAVKAAINHLFPISSLPRSRPSSAASQQLEFSNLALSLLEQASRNCITPSLDKTDVLEAVKGASPRSSPVLVRRKYALVQHLPSGDYWSSLSSGNASDLQNLPTGNAELVAIIPTASSTAVDTVPSLGSVSSRPLAPTKPIIGQRKVSTGVFLDYGPYASFAPAFDNVAALVGQRQLSEVIYQKEQKRKEVEQRRQEQKESSAYIQEVQEEAEEDVVMNAPESEPISDEELNNLLPPEQVKLLKDALGSLELEKAVQTLLDRNAIALKRLAELQTRRLSSLDVKPVEEGSEEWETAQTIMDSLATLASLRPRCSGEDGAPLVPSPAVLRKLHRSLALEPTPGWYGNLPPSKATALHDDSTVKVKSPTIAPAVPPAPAPNTGVPASQPPAATAYPGYPYSYSTAQQPSYRPAAATYAPYKGQQAGGYYQYAVPATAQQSYYGQQPYSSSSNQQPYGSGGTGQQSYQYGSWYSSQFQPAASAPSKPGTPVASAAPTPTSYNTFFAGTNGAAIPRPAAVGNTVANKAISQPAATWPAQTYPPASVAPTLPSHLRTSQTSTPQPVTTPYQQHGGYYQAYQVQPPTSATPSR